MPLYWIGLHDIEPTAEQIGGKAFSLKRLASLGYNVPAWLVVLPAGANKKTTRFELSDTEQRQLSEALLQFATSESLWAVRSSAAAEDGELTSFAGQLESYLNVPFNEVASKVADVRRSGFTDRVRAYRIEHGMDAEPEMPAVIVQLMVPAVWAGVCFSVDPVRRDRGKVIVSAVEGLGESLVSGEQSGLTWCFSSNGQILESPDAAADLPQGLLKDLVTAAKNIERHWQRAVDIEWAWSDGQLHLLQARPVTNLGAIQESNGAMIIWDNSNIAESYNGVTTPLTFSFARTVYSEVYREFCRLLAVPSKKISSRFDVFENMLGLIQGRIYYNLLSWYRVLALLPGFQLNRTFMEQMMGVSEALPREFSNTIAAETQQGKFTDGVNLIRSLLALFWHYLTFGKTREAFYQRMSEAVPRVPSELSQLRADELTGLYRELQRKLLFRWDAPLLNDFFAMFAFGALRSLCAKWLGSKRELLANDLIAGQGGMISAEPASRVKELAKLASQSEALLSQIENAKTIPPLSERISDWDFWKEVDSYLEDFGERCMDELKLESPSLRQDPSPLLASILRLARAGVNATSSTKFDARAEAEAIVAEQLKSKPVKRRIFYWILNSARNRICDRENLRMERTRLFGEVRRIFSELGCRLAEAGHLKSPRDVFYLSVDELIGFVEGTAITMNLKGVASTRIAEFRAFKHDPIANRFETRGIVYSGNVFKPRKILSDDNAELKGTPCCPGVIRARARVVLDPREEQIEVGEILVACRTDPGWAMLFPAASAVLVEYGSLLSHSAIVARELGIPAIVAVKDLTTRVKTGDWLEIDGATGVINFVEPPHDDE